MQNSKPCSASFGKSWKTKIKRPNVPLFTNYCLAVLLIASAGYFFLKPNEQETTTRRGAIHRSSDLKNTWKNHRAGKSEER